MRLCDRTSVWFSSVAIQRVTAGRERLDALGPAPRAELLHVPMLPDLERAEQIGEFWSYPQSRAFAELLIDCEEDLDRAARRSRGRDHKRPRLGRCFEEGRNDDGLAGV